MRINSLDRVDFDKLGVLEKTQTCNAKDCVEYINHITRAIGDAAQLWILTK